MINLYSKSQTGKINKLSITHKVVEIENRNLHQVTIQSSYDDSGDNVVTQVHNTVDVNIIIQKFVNMGYKMSIEELGEYKTYPDGTFLPMISNKEISLSTQITYPVYVQAIPKGTIVTITPERIKEQYGSNINSSKLLEECNKIMSVSQCNLVGIIDKETLNITIIDLHDNDTTILNRYAYLQVIPETKHVKVSNMEYIESEQNLVDFVQNTDVSDFIVYGEDSVYKYGYISTTSFLYSKEEIVNKHYEAIENDVKQVTNG